MRARRRGRVTRPAAEGTVARSHREEGSALGIALVVLFLVGVGTALATGDLTLRLRVVADDAERLALVAMTDAGLAEALAELAADPAFAGYEPSAFGRGTLESTVSGNGTRRRVLVQAVVAGRARAIEAEVELPQPPGSGTPRVLAWRPAGPIQPVTSR